MSRSARANGQTAPADGASAVTPPRVGFSAWPKIGALSSQRSLRPASASAPSRPEAPATTIAGPPAAAPSTFGGRGAATDVQNSYAERTAAREGQAWAKASQVPQHDTLLVHAWAWAVTMYPATALTVWLRRVDPIAGAYEFWVPGDAIMGDYPDRRLFEEVRARRRQPTVAERFAGRIRAVTHEGTPVEIAGGDIQLPPEPATAPTPYTNGAGAPWSQPYGQPPWWGPYSAPPYGAPPYGGPNTYGMPPWPYPWPVPSANPPPPAAIQHDPAMVEMWRSLVELFKSPAHADAARDQSAMQLKLLEMFLDRVGKPPSGANGSVVETLSVLEKAMGLFERLRGDGDKEGVSIVDAGQGVKLVTEGKKVNEGLSTMVSVTSAATGALEKIGQALTTRKGGAADTAAPRALKPVATAPAKAT